MRKCKRIVSAMLAVSMVMGMTAFPALAEPLGIQGESRVETGITVVSNTYTYGNADTIRLHFLILHSSLYIWGARTRCV